MFKVDIYDLMYGSQFIGVLVEETIKFIDRLPDDAVDQLRNNGSVETGDYYIAVSAQN